MNETKLITLAAAARLLPSRNGRHLSKQALLRRILTGSRGIRLKAVKDGGTWYTTELWLREFQDACTKRALGAPQTSQAEIDTKAHERAEKELLRRYGFHVGNNSTTDPTVPVEGQRQAM